MRVEISATVLYLKLPKQSGARDMPCFVIQPVETRLLHQSRYLILLNHTSIPAFASIAIKQECRHNNQITAAHYQNLGQLSHPDAPCCNHVNAEDAGAGASPSVMASKAASLTSSPAVPARNSNTGSGSSGLNPFASRRARKELNCLSAALLIARSWANAAFSILISSRRCSSNVRPFHRHWRSFLVSRFVCVPVPSPKRKRYRHSSMVPSNATCCPTSGSNGTLQTAVLLSNTHPSSLKVCQPVVLGAAKSLGFGGARFFVFVIAPTGKRNGDATQKES